MAPSPLQQRRTHNILLFQKLLNLRDGASPFTLVLDTLEQSGAPIVREFAKRAKIGNSRIIVISYQTLRSKVSFEHDIFIPARQKSLSALRNEILSHTSAATAAPSSQKYLLIIDTLHPLASTNPQHLSLFLSSLLSPNTSLIATLTADIPILSPRPTNLKASQDYHPEPLIILVYLATAILTISSLSQQIAKKQARDRSRQEPSFGLQERKEGVLFGLKAEQKREESVVVDMELRRKSGRGILETFVLTPTSSAQNVAKLMLLDDHPLYSPPTDIGGIETKENDEIETTFSLGLTEKQRKDREGVVLPYFDAQKEGGTAGAGEGGRILYEMGFEDREDFDDEEDEI